MAPGRGPTATNLTRGLRLLGPLVEEGVVQLQANLRSHLLTLVGIAWGAASVVLLLSVGSGFNDFLDLGVKKTGDRWTVLTPRYTSMETGGARPGRKISFSNDDLERLEAAVPSAAALAGQILETALVETPLRTRSTVVSAAGPEIRVIRNHKVARGRFFDADDQRRGRRVAVVGADLVVPLFAGEDPLGKTVQVEGVPFRVVGVLERKGFQLFTNRDLHDRMLWIPLSAGQRLPAWGRGESVDHVLLDPRRRDETGVLHQEIRAALWPLHHLAPQEDDAIQMDTVTSIMAPIEAIGLALHVLLGFVGTVTLAMSAVGVGNLMIAVASERRREFAMRRACGARRSDVALQLLVETGVVVLGAGLLGVAIGVGAVQLLQMLPLPSDLPQPRVAVSVLATTFLVLSAVGLAAGVAPARRAARVDPSAALRAL